MVYKLKILLDQRLDPLYEAVMEATEEAILNAMCMATSMTGVNGNHSPALPLDEVRRALDAFKPIFASVKKRPQQSSAPASRERPSDLDREGEVRVSSARPTQVRGAEGIPFPTRPAPETPESEDPPEGSSSGSPSGSDS
jgi:D-aminopeptidase